MSFQARREVTIQVARRYREASRSQRRTILDEFVAITGYARKYAIRVLAGPIQVPSPKIRRKRAPHYGADVQDALVTAWLSVNCVCARRLVPFLPELVAALEQHGHLTLTPETKAKLLTMSHATADRILAPVRREGRPRGISTTKAGRLLKRQIPIRTFTDWGDEKPGFMEADLVAHCGVRAEGAFLNTLVITDVATGWTEFLPLLHRSQHAVSDALDRMRLVLPFKLLGFDTDNGSEFINGHILTYCADHEITFTRGRAYKKNDQCFVEQKNGVVVRQYVGYDRFEGVNAYRQLGELYGALRLYVNFFQPSEKLLSKSRDGAKVSRKYDAAKTPFQRTVDSGVLAEGDRDRLLAIYNALDPVHLLKQIETMQDALWRQIVPMPEPPVGESNITEPRKRRRESRAKLALSPEKPAAVPVETAPSLSDQVSNTAKRKYRRSNKRAAVAHTWRTREDPFDGLGESIETMLDADPDRTAKSIFMDLQVAFPGRFSGGQLRTLQRRVLEWRKRTLLTFDDTWLDGKVEIAGRLPGPLKPVSTASEAG